MSYTEEYKEHIQYTHNAFFNYVYAVYLSASLRPLVSATNG